MLSLQFVLPLLGIASNSEKNILLTIYFTVLSIARNYLLRRYFNKKKRNP